MKKLRTVVIGTALSVGLGSGGAVALNAERLESQAEIIEAEYTRALGCAAIDVSFTTELDNWPDDYQSGGVSLAKARPGEVLLSASLFAASQEQFGQIIAHEMTHACAGPERTFENAFVAPNGDRMIGNRGFIVFAENPKKNPQQLSFNLIEEGVATALGDRLTGQDQEEHTHIGYVALKELTEELQTKHGISARRLAEMVQNSDLLDFVAIVSDLPSAEQVGLRELSYVMRLYHDRFQAVLDGGHSG